jgi:hypothetical protein
LKTRAFDILGLYRYVTACFTNTHTLTYTHARMHALQAADAYPAIPPWSKEKRRRDYDERRRKIIDLPKFVNDKGGTKMRDRDGACLSVSILFSFPACLCFCLVYVPAAVFVFALYTGQNTESR